QGLLCLDLAQRGDRACGQCASCQVFQRDADSHPDYQLLRPDSVKGYSVESIKEALASYQLHRALSPSRVLIFCEAENFSSAFGSVAGNALLKILEEPRAESFLILLSSRPHSLLATLRSR